MEHMINREMVEDFRHTMQNEEKSKATIEKYQRDVQTFLRFVGENKSFEKETVIAYKQYLIERYSTSSVNSMLAALNSFFKDRGWYDCVVKAIKVQKETFRNRAKELSKEEYFRLLNTAKERESKRLYMVLQTICSTGIRVSELQYITVESLSTRRTIVSLKGKTRVVILPLELCRELKCYVRESNIRSGCVFVTRSGRPLNRSNIWHEMKGLCKEAQVSAEKVFPWALQYQYNTHLYTCKRGRTGTTDRNAGTRRELIRHNMCYVVDIYQRYT